MRESVRAFHGNTKVMSGGLALKALGGEQHVLPPTISTTDDCRHEPSTDYAREDIMLVWRGPFVDRLSHLPECHNRDNDKT